MMRKNNILLPKLRRFIVSHNIDGPNWRLLPAVIQMGTIEVFEVHRE